MNIKTNDRIVVAGKTGSGKTFFTKWLIAILAQNGAKVFVYDHKNNEYNFGKITSNINELTLHPREAVVVYKPGLPTSEKCEKFIAHVLRVRGFAVIEEADNYAKNHHSVLLKVAPKYYELIQLGRSNGCGCLSITRRVQNLNSDLLSQAEHIFCFHQHFASDIKYLEKWVGEKANNITEFDGYKQILYYNDLEGSRVLSNPARIMSKAE